MAFFIKTILSLSQYTRKYARKTKKISLGNELGIEPGAVKTPGERLTNCDIFFTMNRSGNITF